jgi:hypothetical protein
MTNKQKNATLKYASMDELMKLKREGQARCRALFESGEGTQESMFFISPSIQKIMKVQFRD